MKLQYVLDYVKFLLDRQPGQLGLEWRVVHSASRLALSGAACCESAAVGTEVLPQLNVDVRFRG